jgi:membrane associated rhomboid family serine protease
VLALLALTIILVVVFRAMEPDTRKELGYLVLDVLALAKREATRRRPALDQFNEALRARTRWVIVMPALVLLNVVVLVMMLRDTGALTGPETLARWGGNFWLRTRNGEWWRLVTSVFVHRGTLQLLINLAGMVQIGWILERLVGRMIVAVVFLAAGTFASLVNLAVYPMATGVGASGAIFGLYGLLGASAIWGVRGRSNVTIPLVAVKRFAPAVVVCVVYNFVNDSLGSAAELTGLLTGLVCGTVLVGRQIAERRPGPRRAGYAMAATVVLALLGALPLRGITDVKPELARTLAAEDRTSGAYRQAAEQYKRNRMTAEALAQLIDRTIIPELNTTGARLRALEGVPQEHERLVADAEEYVRLRSASWRLRAEWLRTSRREASRGSESTQYRTNNRTIAQAEETERAALDALAKIRPSQSPTSN